MNIKFILSRLSVCAIAVALSIGIAGCDSKEREAGRAIIGRVYPDPPLSITIRASLLTGYVLQLHNTSSVRHVYNVHVKNEAKGQEMNSSFGIPPNEEQEVGILEMDWAFEAGQNGYVSVDGYTKKCYFEILPDGQYKTWYELKKRFVAQWNDIGNSLDCYVNEIRDVFNDKNIANFFEPEGGAFYMLTIQDWIQGDYTDQRTFFSYRAECFRHTGGAHGGTIVKVGTMDVRTGRRLTTADVIPAYGKCKKM